jgi:hypothetical protein
MGSSGMDALYNHDNEELDLPPERATVDRMDNIVCVYGKGARGCRNKTRTRCGHRQKIDMLWLPSHVSNSQLRS